jgi:hypothetical protein
MQPRHVIILLDVDDTLANNKLSKLQADLVYTGTREVWYENMLRLQQKASQQEPKLLSTTVLLPPNLSFYPLNMSHEACKVTLLALIY